MSDKNEQGNMSDNRLTELEIKLGLTEHSVDQLDAVVTRQQQQIDALVQVVQALKSQISSIDDGTSKGSLRDELPPHY